MNIHWAVSHNIKRVREEKKLTLDAAAGATGVSRSMLAHIERGDANPTISILWKIANGYKVSFTSLLKAMPDDALVIRADETVSIVADEGRYTNFPAFPFSEERSFETYRIVITAGGQLEAEAHLAGTDEYITVFAGTVKVCAGEQSFVLDAGDSVRFRADTPHSYENIGQGDVLLSMILHYT